MGFDWRPRVLSHCVYTVSHDGTFRSHSALLLVDSPRGPASLLTANCPLAVRGLRATLDHVGEINKASIGEVNRPMRWEHGERLRPSNPDCRLKVVVLAVGASREPVASLIGHCGSPMNHSYEKRTIHKSELGSGGDTNP